MHDILDGLVPWSDSNKSVRITSLKYEAVDPDLGAECYTEDGDATGDCQYVVQCSEVSGSADRLTNALLAENEDLVASLPDIAEQDTIILTETVVPYEPLIDRLGLGSLDWSNRLAVRPRFVPELSCPGSA